MEMWMLGTGIALAYVSLMLWLTDTDSLGV